VINWVCDQLGGVLNWGPFRGNKLSSYNHMH
jgi:hypothetical protein